MYKQCPTVNISFRIFWYKTIYSTDSTVLKHPVSSVSTKRSTSSQGGQGGNHFYSCMHPHSSWSGSPLQKIQKVFSCKKYFSIFICFSNRRKLTFYSQLTIQWPLDENTESLHRTSYRLRYWLSLHKSQLNKWHHIPEECRFTSFNQLTNKNSFN